MAHIEVTRRGEDDEAYRLHVLVSEGESHSEHGVTLARADHARLAREGETPERLVRRCFEFLLAREPKESILSSFDISVIGRYFPEFEDEISA